MQIELSDLRGRDVDVVRARQIAVVGRAQEAEAVRERLEHPFGEDESALRRLRLQNLEDQILLAKSAGTLDGQVLRHLRQLLNAHLLQVDDVEARALWRRRRRCWRRRRW